MTYSFRLSRLEQQYLEQQTQRAEEERAEKQRKEQLEALKKKNKNEQSAVASSEVKQRLQVGVGRRGGGEGRNGEG